MTSRPLQIRQCTSPRGSRKSLLRPASRRRLESPAQGERATRNCHPTEQCDHGERTAMGGPSLRAQATSHCRRCLSTKALPEQHQQSAAQWPGRPTRRRTPPLDRPRGCGGAEAAARAARQRERGHREPAQKLQKRTRQGRRRRGGRRSADGRAGRRGGMPRSGGARETGKRWKSGAQSACWRWRRQLRGRPRSCWKPTQLLLPLVLAAAHQMRRLRRPPPPMKPSTSAPSTDAARWRPR